MTMGGEDSSLRLRLGSCYGSGHIIAKSNPETFFPETVFIVLVFEITEDRDNKYKRPEKHSRLNEKRLWTDIVPKSV